MTLSHLSSLFAPLIALSALALPSHAQNYQVTIEGTVDYSGIPAAPWSSVAVGTPCTITFEVGLPNIQAPGQYAVYPVDRSTLVFDAGGVIANGATGSGAMSVQNDFPVTDALRSTGMSVGADGLDGIELNLVDSTGLAFLDVDMQWMQGVYPGSAFQNRYCAVRDANWNELSFWASQLTIGVPSPDPTAFCFGDGSDGAVCPCGNTPVAGTGEGCRNNTGVGAYIASSGTPSVTNDTYVLTVRQAVPNESGIFVQNISTGTATPFYDGVLCLEQNAHLIRHYAPGVPATMTDATGSGTNLTPLTTGDWMGDTAAGVTVYYQFWGRDNTGPCGTGATFSSGLAQTWIP